MCLFCKCCESIKPAASCNKIAHSDWLKEVSSALFLFDDLSPVLLSPSAVGPGSGENHHGIQISHRRRQHRPVPPQRVPAGLRKLRQVRRRRPSARDAAARSWRSDSWVESVFVTLCGSFSFSVSWSSEAARGCPLSVPPRFYFGAEFDCLWHFLKCNISFSLKFFYFFSHTCPVSSTCPLHVPLNHTFITKSKQEI